MSQPDPQMNEPLDSRPQTGGTSEGTFAPLTGVPGDSRPSWEGGPRSSQDPLQESAEPSNRPVGSELPERFALPSAEVLAEAQAAAQEKARANRGVDVFQTQGMEEDEAYQPDFFDKAPPFMLSLMLHVVGLVALALIVFTTRLVVQKTIAIEAKGFRPKSTSSASRKSTTSKVRSWLNRNPRNRYRNPNRRRR